MTEYGRIHTDGSRSGGQPVEAQQRALAIANTLLGIDRATLGELSHHELMMALVRIVPQHDAARQELSDFKQKVSDAAEEATEIIDHWSGDRDGAKCLQDFIIPKPQPDPLVEVAVQCFGWCGEADAEKFRRKLDALGFEIREKNDG